MDIDSSATDGRRSDEVQEEKQNFHVLAVDDSNLDRKLLERLLTVSSYQVTCVDSGDKALEYLGLLDNIEDNVCEGSPPPPPPPPPSSLLPSTASAAGLSSPKSPQQEISKVSLIMTDYSMPGINGYDLLKRIKDSSWKDVPVVVMSSENVPSRINMCLEGGAEEFLLKPVKLSDLRKLHSHLLKYSISHPCKPGKSDEHDSVSSIENALNVNIEDSESDSNCSNANKRKATPSDLSDRRPRVQELPVS